MTPEQRVLELLYDRRDSFYAPDELSAAAGMEFDRLPQLLADLSQGGYRTESSPPHGIRLVRPVKLSAHLIERDLGTRRVGRNVICFDEVDSTNDVAFDSARQADTDGLAVLAESQRRGRGRFGRQWISPAGANVLMSVLLIERPQGLPHDVLTIAAGIAVAEGIEVATGLSCQLKWPNDVLLAGSKVAGVLVETRPIAAGRAVVIGLGINANAAPPASAVARPATCLADRLYGPVERNELVHGVLRQMDAWLTRLADGAADALHDAWMRRCDMVNRRVRVRAGGREYVGRVLDVHPRHGLILQRDSGQEVRLPAEGATLLD